MPRRDAASGFTMKPLTTEPPAGDMIETVGGGISEVPGPNTFVSFKCELTVGVHTQGLAAKSPHCADLLRKNFWPPQSAEYVIGSLHADWPSTNLISWFGRPYAWAISCEITQQMPQTWLPSSSWAKSETAVSANANAIWFVIGEQSPELGPTPPTPVGRPISCGKPATIASLYSVGGRTSVTV